MSAAHVARELLKRENALTRDDTDFFKWRACFEGPPDSLYEDSENNGCYKDPEEDLWADLFDEQVYL